jgi:excisionase family DNA binding protein
MTENSTTPTSNAQGSDAILTVVEVAQALRCSKVHVSKMIHGKVRGASPLPVIHLGRRIVVRQSTLQAWLSHNEM